MAELNPSQFTPPLETSQSGGINISAGSDATVGGDVVGHDKIQIHAGAGATTCCNKSESEPAIWKFHIPLMRR